ncbi:MAG: S-adenosylmethionine:tRNA ribosyltransferase-isomerase [Bacteroidales bacterium]|nr:S-adenosylmethionine:tRNA ribosyltransferase-isomerase [Bacteroidales bacterium]
MNVTDITIDSYDYALPDERIARHPLAERDHCRLLVRNAEGEISHHRFDELPELLAPDTLLVYNDTRVINARLRFRKASAMAQHEGASIEVFCLEPLSPADYERAFASTAGGSWLCFVGNSKRWKNGPLALKVDIPEVGAVTLVAERLEKRGNASVIHFSWDNPQVTFSQIISAAGEIPIPPYLNRSTEEADSTDYQTVYSRWEGSVAAPTAGLHFTPELLDRLDKKGVLRVGVTLHVGAGTFQPVKSSQIGDHPMHSEWISVERSVIERLAAHKGPIVAVGTTSVRTLESLYHIGCLMKAGQWHGEVEQWWPYSGAPQLAMSRQEALATLLADADISATGRLIASTRIIIAPGYRYRIVDRLITNFHQPRSTLLLLVAAMIGDDWRSVYNEALHEGYRFLSYGDACLFE